MLNFALNSQDYSLIIISIAIWILFFFIGIDRAFKIYFWLFLGFLIAMVLWLQSEIITLKIWMDLNSFEKIIVTKRELIKNYASLFVVFFMIWMLFNNSIFFTTNKKSIFSSIFSFLLWFFLFLFFFWTLFILEKYWIKMNSLFAYIAWFLSDSNIFKLIKKYDYLIYYFLFFVTFYRIILHFFFVFIFWIAKRIKEIREEEQARIIIADSPKKKEDKKIVTKIELNKDENKE